MAIPIEWCHLPPEVHQMVSEQCDFLSRSNLQLTCKAMKSIVDSSKAFIPAVKLTEKPDDGVRLNFILQDYWEVPRNYEVAECGTVINKKTEVDGKSPVEAALEDFKKFCIRKRITIIGCVHLETSGESEELVEKVEALLESNKKVLKIKKIEWDRNGENLTLAWSFLNFSRLDELHSIKVSGNATSTVELFANVDHDILSKLSRLEVLSEIDASPEDVLSLNASKIHLQSEKFDTKLMIGMLEKWMEDSTKPVGSILVLKNTKSGNLTANLTDKIPNSFQKMDSFENQVLRYKLPLENSRIMILRTGPHGISVEIQNPSANLFDDFCQKQREQCLTRIRCCCQAMVHNVDFRFLSHYEEINEYDDYEDNDEEPAEFNYEFDDGGWRSELDDSDLEEYLQYDEDDEYDEL